MNRAGLAVIALLVGAAGCSRTPVEADSKQAPPRNPLEITLTAELEKQVVVGEVETRPVTGNLVVAARVEADETRKANVGSPVTGRITEAPFNVGDAVHKGQVIARLTSTELTTAQLAFMKADSQRQLAQRAVDRARQLLSAGVIGSAEVQRRGTELAQAGAEKAAARDELAVLGMPEESIQQLEMTRTVNSVAQILASIDGIVMERRATVGQVVAPADTVYVLADLSSVWLVADVPEQAAESLAVGKSVETEVTAFEGQKIFGRLSYVSSLVNPETRTIRVRMELANAQHRFKPAMLATMTLKEGAQMRRVVPTTAVVREGNDDNVMVEIAPKKFVLRRVLLGDEFEGRRLLEDGISPGQKIAIQGAFHLNNERRRQSLQAGGE